MNIAKKMLVDEEMKPWGRDVVTTFQINNTAPSCLPSLMSLDGTQQRLGKKADEPQRLLPILIPPLFELCLLPKESAQLMQPLQNRGNPLPE